MTKVVITTSKGNHSQSTVSQMMESQPKLSLAARSLISKLRTTQLQTQPVLSKAISKFLEDKPSFS